MAITASILTPAGGSTNAASNTADISGTIGPGLNTAAPQIVLGPYTLFAINANTDVMIRFGRLGMPNANTTDFRIPGGVVATYQMPKWNDRISLYNPSASANTGYWIQPLVAQG
jgi:hypothetical protein